MQLDARSANIYCPHSQHFRDKEIDSGMTVQRHILKQELLHIPRSTALNGLPLANIMFSPKTENASSGVHSAVTVI